jgi:hypothetical protein
MAQREDPELECRAAPKEDEKRAQKGGQQVPEGESKGKEQVTVYQSDRILRVGWMVIGVEGTATYTGRNTTSHGTLNIVSTPFRSPVDGSRLQ